MMCRSRVLERERYLLRSAAASPNAAVRSVGCESDGDDDDFPNLDAIGGEFDDEDFEQVNCPRVP